MVAGSGGPNLAENDRLSRAREAPRELLMRQAAHLRACGATWAEVGQAVNKSGETVRHWPERYPREWATANQGAAEAVRGMVAQVGAAALKRLVEIATSAMAERRCPRCRGLGWLKTADKSTQDCPKCDGEGVVQIPDLYLRKQANDTIAGLWRAVLPSQMEIGGVGGEALTFEQAMARVVEARKNGGNGNGNGGPQKASVKLEWELW